MKESVNQQNYQVNEKGSLGLLALGDIGIKLWRDAKRTAKQMRQNEKEK